ncbi:LuxR C-terminal-related transcriptional regulator [Kocuria turfanensis]|uniref:LuxR C-terminal-related transcriptional regulator n=1 Tax=Kocuria turfanensis TaxID=388357 RepID=UPI0040369345
MRTAPTRGLVGASGGLTATRSLVPRLPAGLVRRPRLERLLDDGVADGTVVVSGPAGSGKTLLLASWATGRRPPVAWLSVEPADADPHQFWARVLSSLQAVHDVPPTSPLATLHPPSAHDPRFVSVLVEACTALPGPRVLVLDDAHLIAGTPAEQSLAAVVRRGLGGLRLVVATRTAPGLPLQRLRLEGRLTELRAGDLEFDAEESAQLLRAHGVVLPPAQLAALLEKTEGWAAGLRLAALSLESSGDLGAVVEQLAGDQRAVADYFVQEVLDGQDPELTGFLLDTCVVHRISGDLADALTGRADGRLLLGRLARANLFVVALDDRGEWYRCHQLFGDLLRHRLRTQAPERRQELHRRAAAWFAARGELLEAARHLRAAEDWTALARFVLRSAGAEMLGTERAALVALLADVPVDLVTRHAEVAAATTVASYAEYDAGGLASRIARARALLPGLPPRDAQLTEAVLTTLEALLAWMHADAAAQVRSSEQALRRLEDVLPEEMPAVPVYRIAATTVQAMGRLWSGELGEAETALRRTIRAVSARQAMTPVLALHLHGNLAVLEAMGGRLHAARRDVDIALAVAEESGWTFLPQAATAYLAESLIRLLEADTEACAAALARGLACVGNLRDRYAETGLSLVGARLEVSRGDLRAARAGLAQLRRRTADWAMPRFLGQWCTLVEAEVLLAEGHPEEVAHLLAAARPAAAGERPHAHRLVLLARSRLVAGRPQECLQVLQPLLEHPPEDRGPATDLWVLAALAHDRLREDAPAQAALDRALTVAAPEGIARPFLVAGDGALRLLERHGRAHPSHGGFAAHLIERLGGAARPAAPPGPAEPLTNRERSVLQLLPTMMSNSEIAGELYLSVNTVKVHLKSLYRKLGVGTRRQAVLRAGELGLLGGSSSGPTITRRG